jgi:hypothetical protein
MSPSCYFIAIPRPGISSLAADIVEQKIVIIGTCLIEARAKTLLAQACSLNVDQVRVNVQLIKAATDSQTRLSAQSLR